jgi:quinol monooxygenase YgiN
MEDKKIYLLAELTIRPGFLEEVKAILKEALIPTLQEPGCEALYETGRKDDPHKLAQLSQLEGVADLEGA